MTVDVARSLRKMFVDGEWVGSESGRTFDAVSPATGAVIAQVPEGTRADARQAVEAAHNARSAVAGLKGFERSRRLHRIADAIERRREDLARILTLDQGKPLLAEAYGEVDEAAEYFRIAAETSSASRARSSAATCARARAAPRASGSSSTSRCTTSTWQSSTLQRRS